MRLEARSIKQTAEQFSEFATENKKSKKNKKRLKKSMPSVIQKLFDTCKEVFANGGPGYIPSPSDVERLCLILDDMKPKDVGLTQDMPYFKMIEKEGSPPITYLHLYECDKFSIAIFCLPRSAVIPLHNHPGMTVFSKLLFGSMHIKSYDWVTDVPRVTNNNLNPRVTNNNLNPMHCLPRGVRLAEVKVDSVFTTPCNTSILYPADGGNMHCFTASTSCAVLDVLGPPYCDEEGRHCTYYNEYPYANFSGDDDESIPTEGKRDGYYWLEEKETPEDLVVLGAPYLGPQIVED